MDDRNEQIHNKGFDMTRGGMDNLRGDPIDYSKIKIGLKTVEDAILNLGSLKSNSNIYANKNLVLKVLADNDLKELRAISDFFYRVNGTYERVCNYFAQLYRYDWYVVPEVYDNNKKNKIIEEFSKILNYLDNSYIKKLCNDIALEVIKSGAYYGYVIMQNDKFIIQQLPINYCRSRYSIGSNPTVEFNMRFFDECFKDPGYRMRVIKLFPPEFAKGYILYKQGKLLPDYLGDTAGSWYLLDPKLTVKFNFNNSDVPTFVNAIPNLLDLDAAQDLDRRKQMQNLLKIIVQKLPLDKNNDLIFDIDEARDIHNNAVQMLSRAIGVDIVTTFADVDSIDLSDKNTSTTTDELERVERSVFNSFGVSQNLFNTDGNLSLEKSILNDESTVRNLLLQFQIFFDRILELKNINKKKYNFKIYMLETTQYNYKELSKMYKEQDQIGFSKVLPQIALGHSQSAILNTAHFENEILHLSEVMIPPLMSSTLSGEDILGKSDKTSTTKSQITTEEKSSTGGRPKKEESQKSEKTIQNQESMN